MEAPKESLEKKNIFAEKYDEIRRLDGMYLVDGRMVSLTVSRVRRTDSSQEV